MFGRPVQSFGAVDLEAETEENILARFKKICDVVLPAANLNAEKANEKLQEQFAKSRKNVSGFSGGTSVMIRNQSKKSKLDPAWVGPYVVRSRTNRGTYVLEDMTGELKTRNVAPSQLKIIRSPPVYTDKEFEVDAIIAHSGKSPNFSYKVRWKGYGPEHDTWIPADYFKGTEVISDYWERIGQRRSRSKKRPRGGEGQEPQ
jgi:hypothetical protein